MEEMIVVDGNKAAAWGAVLSRPMMVAAYPITPQTPLVEYLSQFIADGVLDADLVEVEGEHSALSVLQGASLAGGRVFTGTSGQGLAFMFEPYIRTAPLRLPIVMVIATRDGISPQCVWGGQQDAVTVRDGGWIQIYVENNQEILDTVIMAYKIGEDPEILLPVNVCYDGFYLSHMSEAVKIPDQTLVDRFLPPYKPTHVKLDPETPMAVDPLTPGILFTQYRQGHLEAQEKAKAVIERVDEEFGHLFGRSYGGLVENYRMEDAEIALVAMGSPCGTGKVAIDRIREKGVKAGLVKVRSLRPFPRERLLDSLKGVKAIGVIDKNVCFGWGTGVLYVELSAALQSLSVPILDFIGGLGGSDITFDHFEFAMNRVLRAMKEEVTQTVHWFSLD
ncbi:MAG: phenylglyoxylate dehydrogenase [Deltaproteobacteria bacterium RBG_16_49_23]|nr:MAG: phenylglyoxylate dehydrogenase [Deltaproteobacteria bacterium RBG_16_49_23]